MKAEVWKAGTWTSPAGISAGPGKTVRLALVGDSRGAPKLGSPGKCKVLNPQPFHWEERSWGAGLLGLQTPLRDAEAPTWQPDWQENGVGWVSLGEVGKTPVLAGLPRCTAQACPLRVPMGTRGPDKGLGPWAPLAPLVKPPGLRRRQGSGRRGWRGRPQEAQSCPAASEGVRPRCLACLLALGSPPSGQPLALPRGTPGSVAGWAVPERLCLNTEVPSGPRHRRQEERPLSARAAGWPWARARPVPAEHGPLSSLRGGNAAGSRCRQARSPGLAGATRCLGPGSGASAAGRALCWGLRWGQG